jgi:hypothetical protein
MRIEICTTNEWSNNIWDSYIFSFNSVFRKDFEYNYFKRKYLKSTCGFSFHALLLSDNNQIVGGCTVIPFNYFGNKELFLFGQAVDVFIVENYRTDPLMLLKMYSQLKSLLHSNHVRVVLAVPNKIAYPYWKNIVKWKDLGDLNYWIFPIKLGNITNSKFCRALNGMSIIFAEFLIFLNNCVSFCTNSKSRDVNYEIEKSENFASYRYDESYEKIEKGDIQFIFKIYIEDGKVVAYLYDFNEKGNVTFKSLVKAVSYIKRFKDIDVVVFVGKLNFTQFLMLKVPKKMEPKRLPLVFDIISPGDYTVFSDIGNFRNWNYSLLNYDVR